MKSAKRSIQRPKLEQHLRDDKMMFFDREAALGLSIMMMNNDTLTGKCKLRKQI